jgi:hypothetical protein
MVMRINQPGQDNLPAQIKDRIRGLRQLGCRTDLLDGSIDGKNSGIFQFPSRTIHGDKDLGVPTQYASHKQQLYSTWTESGSNSRSCSSVLVSSCSCSSS